MNTFESLLDRTPEESPAETQRRAREAFPNLVNDEFARWFYLRKPDTYVPDQGLELILGVATYSLYDLRLLDEIVEAQRGGVFRPRRVGVFDILECKKMTDVHRYLPSVDAIASTPVLATYSSGRISDFWEGYWRVSGAVRQLIGTERAV